jgi:hypothetical protein
LNTFTLAEAIVALRLIGIFLVSFAAVLVAISLFKARRLWRVSKPIQYLNVVDGTLIIPLGTKDAYGD